MEARIVAEGQAAGQHRAKSPGVGLLDGSHHLELAEADARAFEGFGEEGAEVGPSADDDLIDLPGLAIGRADLGYFDRSYDRVEAKLDPVGFVEPARYPGDRLPRVNADLGRAPERPSRPSG